MAAIFPAMLKGLPLSIQFDFPSVFCSDYAVKGDNEEVVKELFYDEIKAYPGQQTSLCCENNNQHFAFNLYGKIAQDIETVSDKISNFLSTGSEVYSLF